MKGRRTRGSLWAIRAAIIALAIPLFTGGALPFLVALLFPTAHVCHCAVERHTCFCAKCHPDEPDFFMSKESISGHCGDDDDTPLTNGRFVAVIPFGLDRAAPVADDVAVPLRLVSGRPVSVLIRPPTPPPKA